LDAEFRQLYADYTNAVESMDTEKFKSFFASTFSMTSADGKNHDRAEMDNYWKVNAETTRNVKAASNEIEAITQVGKEEVAIIVLQKYERDQAPLDAPDKQHRIKTSVVQREICKKEAEGWKIQRVEEILIGPIYLDGKPMPN
jgi:hypothetical protein